jgi:Domain of unknown function (DUF4440)
MAARVGRVGAFVDVWAHAERRGDVTLLQGLLDDRFVAVDADETLDKQAWLARYRSGGLVHHAFCWRTIDVRVDAHCAFVIGEVEHSSSYCGHDASGRGTVTLTVTAQGRRWQLAGLHISALATWT